VSAVISDCGKYRYVLRRSLTSVVRWYRPCTFVMLNPSTAGANNDDATIRRCIYFAQREGMTHLNVVNLFALRATDPKDILKANDPIGPDNDFWLKKEIVSSSLVIAGWGSNKCAKDRAEEIVEKFGPFMCLGITKNNSPKHPLYLKKDTPLIEFKPRPKEGE